MSQDKIFLTGKLLEYQNAFRYGTAGTARIPAAVLHSPPAWPHPSSVKPLLRWRKRCFPCSPALRHPSSPRQGRRLRWQRLHLRHRAVPAL